MVKIDAKYHRDWRKRNRNYLVTLKRYRDSEHGKRVLRNGRLKRAFGITLKEYDEMLLKQGNRCAICGTHQSKLKKNFDIDHDHSTGKIRGLLCNACNQGMGLLGESVEIMSKAIAYLKRETSG